MTIFQAIVLGAVQGVTEFLPVSSDGHLSLLQQWFQLEGNLFVFDVTVHFATFLAIVFFFYKDIVRLRLRDMVVLGVGTLPTVAIGFAILPYLEELTQMAAVVGGLLIVSGLYNFYSHRRLAQQQSVEEDLTVFQPAEVSFKHSFLIGCAQALAVLPGLSRSGGTVAVGAWAGLTRRQTFSFSFLLGLPAILGATILAARQAVVQGIGETSAMVLLAGFATAGLVGYASLKLLAILIAQGRLNIFGWYCVIVGVVVLLSSQM